MSRRPDCRHLLLFAVLAAFLLFGRSGEASTTEELFPRFACLENNVAFWKKVYTEYPSTYGFIHDTDDLSVIYEVLELEDRNIPGAPQRNKERIDAAKGRYQRILSTLASGGWTGENEEMRVIALLGNMPTKERLARAAESVRFQLCLRDRFSEGIVRSGLYLDEIRTILVQHGLPIELAYLPHVESSFNYEAYSKVGAAGIWQFMRSTGRRFLTVGSEIDERRDPLKATHAAARYLKENHDRLGSWPFAITAYNHGAAGMARAKTMHGGFDNVVQDYDSPSFGFASRNFYAEFLAAMEVANNPRAYFGDLPVAEPLRFFEFELSARAPAQTLSRFFQVELPTFQALNPALGPSILSGKKPLPRGYRVRLPGSPEQHEERLAIATRPPEPSTRPQPPPGPPGLQHTVGKGDTANRIAKRYGISLDELIATNRLDRKATVRAGQTLIIPGALVKATSSPPPAPLASSATASAQPRPPAPPSTSAPVADAAPPGKEKSKDPSPTSPPVLAEASSPAPAPLPATAGNLAVEHVVEQKGRTVGIIRAEAAETLGHYAEWLGVPAQALQKLNGLQAGQKLAANQKVSLPLDKEGKARFEAKRAEHHKAIMDDFFAAHRIVGVKRYTVRKGDTVWSICSAAREIPVWLLRKYNDGVRLETLRPRQTIVVPVVEKAG